MSAMPEELARDEALLDALGARRPVADPLGAMLSAWAATCDEPSAVVIPISRARRRGRGAVIGLFALAVAVTGGSAAAAKDPTLPVLGALFGGLFDRSGTAASAALTSGSSSQRQDGDGLRGGADTATAIPTGEAAVGLPLVGYPQTGQQPWGVIDLPGTAASTPVPLETAIPGHTSTATHTSTPTATPTRPTATSTHPTGGGHTGTPTRSATTPGSATHTRPGASATSPTHKPTAGSVSGHRPLSTSSAVRGRPI